MDKQYDKTSLNRVALGGILFLSFLTVTWSCSAIVLKNDQSVYLAKNFDWTYNNGYVIKNLRNINKQAYSTFLNQPMKWTSKYGSISFNQNGKEMPYGGINEKGLAVEMLWLNYTEYRMDPKLPLLNELEWIQYQLDNFASVQEVIDHLEQISISPFKGKIHYMVADADGHSVVIEHLGGKIKYELQPASQCQAITNYDLTTSKNWFANNKNSTKGNVTQALFRYTILQTEIEDADLQKTLSVPKAFEMLDHVAIKKGDFKTQWSIVYDLKKKLVYFKSTGNKEVRHLALMDLDFNQNIVAIDVNKKGKGYSNNEFLNYTSDLNTQLIKLSFTQLGLEKLDFDEISGHQFTFVSPAQNTYTNQYCTIRISITASDQQNLGRLGIAIYDQQHINYSKPFKDALHQVLINAPSYSWLYYGLPKESYVIGAAQDVNNNRRPDYEFEKYAFTRDGRVVNGSLPAFEHIKINMAQGINQVDLVLKKYKYRIVRNTSVREVLESLVNGISG